MFISILHKLSDRYYHFTILLKGKSYIGFKDEQDMTLMSARLFPVLHLSQKVGMQEILWIQDGLEDPAGQILDR